MKRSNVIAIHLLFWVMMVVVPTLIWRLDDLQHGPDLLRILRQNLVNVIIFYLTYWVFVPFILKKRKTWELVILSVAWILVLAAARLLEEYYFKEVLKPLESRPFVLERQIVRELFGTLMFTLYPVLIYFSIEWFKERQVRFELAREKQKSEIDLLKSQMNPHFLMNTLNNLYSLVYKGSDKASEAVLKLSEIMRYMLYDTKAELVPLEDEIKYLRAFIELQTLRIKNQELVDIQVEGEIADRMVAPMLFIPFVENAFKHGNKNLPGMSIRIYLSAREDRIVFHVFNFKAKKEIQKDSGKGIGLANVKRRLELQYPDRYSLDIEDAMDSFEVKLDILDE